ETSMLSIGLEHLAGRKKVFVNFGREMLLEGLTSVLPKGRAVIEILETVESDAAVIGACRDLRKQGYLLALDDYIFQAESEPLLKHADFVKVEIQSRCPEGHRTLVGDLHSRGLKALAEKVETPEEFAIAFGAGYDYFQGFFLAKPTMHCSQQ